MANIFYQKLKCLLSVASNVYLIKLILQLHMNKKSNLLLGFVKLLLYFCTEPWILPQKCAMCGRVLSLRYHGEFAMSKSQQICIMCVKTPTKQSGYGKMINPPGELLLTKDLLPKRVTI